MYIAVLSVTESGAKMTSKLIERFNNKKCTIVGYAKYPLNNMNKINKNIYDTVKSLFYKYDALIFICSVGIAVRAVAPFIVSKDKDPAVVVIDDGERYIIPILSGHLGGSNSLASEIEKVLNAKAVITTATDIHNKFAVDVWSKEAGLHIWNINTIKLVSSSLLRDEEVGFISDYEVIGNLPEGLVNNNSKKVGILVSDKIVGGPFQETLYLIPKNYNLGIGCRKNLPYKVLKEELEYFLLSNGILKEQIRSLGSIHLKADEEALLNLARELKVPFYTFSQEELLSVKGDFAYSNFVEKITGIGNICERAASCLGGELTIKKQASNGVTIAASMIEFQCYFRY